MAVAGPLLLAPAGSVAAVRAAIAAGADAVYVGVKGWSRGRPGSELTDEEIFLCLKELHGEGKQLHLAMNTIPRPHEVGQMVDKMRQFARWGIDGAILNDPGMIALVHREVPALRICASVGCTTLNAEDAALLHELGAQVVVVSWAVDPSQIALIKSRTPVEIEVFVRGVQEVLLLGKCWMGSYLKTVLKQHGDRKDRPLGSAKRGGLCTSICKAPWDLTVRGEELSREALPYKTFLVIWQLPAYLRSGVSVLKIGGRELPPDRVAHIVHLFRTLLDRCHPSLDDGAWMSVVERVRLEMGPAAGPIELWQ